MSSLTAFFIVCAVLFTCTPVLLWQIHRAWRAEQAKNCDPYEVGAGERADMSLADRDLCERLWRLPAYGTDGHTTTNPTGDQP